MRVGFLWENLDAIRAILIVSSTVPFILFASAGIWHFGGTNKSGTKLVSIVSLLGFISIIYTIYSTNDIYAWSALGVAMQSISVFMFGWCIGTSGKRNLSLAFSDNCSPRLITEGPYSIVRHPFYTCYIIYWIGGYLVASSILPALLPAMLIVIYFFESRREDEVLSKLFKDEFAQWHKNTGAFFPKWR